VPGRGIASSPLPLPPDDAGATGATDLPAGASASGDKSASGDSAAVEKAEAEVHP
jgi:hypothetical protein